MGRRLIDLQYYDTAVRISWGKMSYDLPTSSLIEALDNYIRRQRVRTIYPPSEIQKKILDLAEELGLKSG